MPPPNASPEAERHLLGVLIRDALPFPPDLVPADFYEPKLQDVAYAIRAVEDQGGQADELSVILYLRSTPFDSPDAFVSSLTTDVGFSAYNPAWAGEVRRQSLLRSIAETTAKAAALAADPAADPEAVLAFTAGQLKAATERAKKSDAGVVAMDFDALETFDRKADPNCVIGSRWMCRGYSCLLVSQSGVGKSSFSLQFMICLALRKSFFGIEAKRPLKVLFLQNENDEGDVSEALQDITGGMNLHFPERQQLKQNLVIYRLKRFTGQDFLDKMRDLIRLHAADVVVIDPLMAFIGIPAADQEAMTDWCRRGLDAVLTETGAVLFAVHHTTKPRSAKDKEGQTAADLAYSGAGASELVNYMREVAVLERCAGEEPVFKFSLTKRRGRSDLRDNNGDFAPSIYVRHSPTRGVIRWERSTPPTQDSDSSPSKGSRRRFDKE